MSAQSLIAPNEVVIYVHNDVKNTDFVEGLVCELGRVLAAPVRATDSNLPLFREQLAAPTQFAPSKILPAFAKATAGDVNGRVFRFLVLPYDLKSEPWRYVFAETYMGSISISIQSVIRLVPAEPGLSRKRVSDVTGDRLYKLMLKAIGRMSGLQGEGCVLAFPRSLEELDMKSPEFCPAHRAAMVQAGILKEKPFGACNTVAMATP